MRITFGILTLVAAVSACGAANVAQAQIPLGGAAGGGFFDLGDEFGDALAEAMRSRQAARGPEHIPDLSGRHAAGGRGGHTHSGRSWLSAPQPPRFAGPQFFPVDPGYGGRFPDSAPPMAQPFGPLPAAGPLQGLPLHDTPGTRFTPVDSGFGGPQFDSTPYGPPPTFPPSGGLPFHDTFGP